MTLRIKTPQIKEIIVKHITMKFLLGHDNLGLKQHTLASKSHLL